MAVRANGASTVENSAKRKFAQALEELLKGKNLDDIQVSEIVLKAGLSRRTFYRHFQDKYDLASWFFSQFFEGSFGQITEGADWETAFLKYLAICEQKAAVLRNAYSSRDVNGLRNYDIDVTRKTYETYLIAKGADIRSKEMKFAIEIAARGGTDMVIRWLICGMKEEKEVLADLIKRTLPREVLAYLE
ncbi:TetR/AcrR family transcriptional regulator C-terminal domain-containing protein [Clostridium sp. AM58-1XD]|uniref:TetR/AcrR family transcriptional regulator C-terminal domain-containing protein n=1 Tax=Clostridium sp. AM58-1XD TaxID=2292307 RepID=UPI000E4BA951|nr:TetR/AcrR family transcriptional regulator C-terminal domain-containing protein [Clostridium sp. AM58-1XD]RGZ01774.1 TetR family transcriptional regulator [Clostridium sp. AM58-1XD]